MVNLVPFDVFDNVAEPGLLHTYSVPTYAHGVCVYIVRDGKRKGEGEGWRDRNRESKRVRGRYKSVFHGWLCCYGNKMWAPYSQKSVLLPSSLPSLLSLSLSHHFISLSSSSRHPQHLHLSLLFPFPPVTSHHMLPLSLSLSLFLSLSQSLIPLLSSILSPPTHLPLSLSVHSLPLLFFTLPQVSSPSSPPSLSLSTPLFPCLSLIPLSL